MNAIQRCLSGLLAAATLSAPVLHAQTIPVTRVVDDIKAVDRVADASRRDLPADLLKRIVNEDIDLLRGKRSDDTYLYAGYERMEAGREEDSFSIQPTEEGRFTSVEAKGSFVYRVILQLPSRRMIVTRNRPVWIERVEIEYIPQNSAARKAQVVNVAAWLQPGNTKTIELDDIARQATIRVSARADKKSGYGNVDVTLVKARVFDNPDSPYADEVASAKAIIRALDHNDIASIRAMAGRIRSRLEPAAATAAPAVAVAPDPTHSIDVIAPRADNDVAPELQAIEDLLTGSETERRQGLDRLHQLIRKLRSR